MKYPSSLFNQLSTAHPDAPNTLPFWDDPYIAGLDGGPRGIDLSPGLPDMDVISQQAITGRLEGGGFSLLACKDGVIKSADGDREEVLFVSAANKA